MKSYKLWVHIEEFDDETGNYKDLTGSYDVEACSIGLFDSVEEAIVYSEMLAETQYERIASWTFAKSADQLNKVLTKTMKGLKSVASVGRKTRGKATMKTTGRTDDKRRGSNIHGKRR